jgi:tRNA nucleotidyltransferase (CCA-adding enzyme)
VSRERVGKELEGMLSGLNAHPVRALSLLMEWRLAPVVLALPVPALLQCRALTITTNNSSVLVPFSSQDEVLAWDQARRILPLIPTVWQSHTSHMNSAAVNTPSQANERLLILASVLLPLRHVVVTDLINKNSSAVTFIVKESLKFKNADIAAISTLVSLVDEAANVLRAVHSSRCNMDHHGKSGGDNGTNSIRPSRLEAGLLVRQAKDLWLTLLLLATVLLLHQQQQDEEDDSASSTVDWIQVGAHAHDRIVSLGLYQCWQWRPLLDGQALMSTLRLPRGPTVGLYMEEQVRWMLAHPDGTLDDCVSYLQAWVAPATTASTTFTKRGDKRKQNGA